MIVVKGTKANQVDSACIRASSQIHGRVILRKGGGGRIDSNSSVCETLCACEQICLIENGH